MTLPIRNYTWIFFIVLTIIIFAPILLEKLKIPHLLGMIMAGILIGQNGFNILVRDNSFEQFGHVGIYYIMFLAALEMDLDGLMKHLKKSVLFGLITFVIPFLLSLLVCVSLLDMLFLQAVLISSIFGSHTLVAYTIVSKYGQTRNPLVVISIGATIVSLFVSLLILAVLSGIFSADNGLIFWLFFIVKFSVYIILMFFVFPRISAWFLKYYADNVIQYIFILTMLFLSAGLAELAGMDGIFGAFIAGIVLNRQVPRLSPLMNRIEFVGNALFIPYFLIGVGMLINIKVLFSELSVAIFISVLIIVATLGKWLAAWFTQKIFSFDAVGRHLLFGLTNAHAAGALAIALVGTKLEISPGQYLVNDEMLNAIVVLILVSCVISSLFTESAVRRIALSSENIDRRVSKEEHILVTYSNPRSVDYLTNLALMIFNNIKGNTLIGLHVTNVQDVDNDKHKQSKKYLEDAANIASSMDVNMLLINRVSTNIVSGIIHTMKEQNVSDLVIGLHYKKKMTGNFWGYMTEHLILESNREILIVRCIIPPSLFKKITVAVPLRAEFESGFSKWVDRVCCIAKQASCVLQFIVYSETIPFIQDVIDELDFDVKVDFKARDNSKELVELHNISSIVNKDGLMIIIASRQSSLSYDNSFSRIPYYVDEYFSHCSIIVIYPEQYGEEESVSAFY